jgi:hypothetical protein
VGFLAAVFNNGIDCVQNVFSKKLLSTHYNYVNLQVRARASSTLHTLQLRQPTDSPPPLPSAPAAPRARTCPARKSREADTPISLCTPANGALPYRVLAVRRSSTPRRRRSWCSYP